MDNLLDIKNLSVEFTTEQGRIRVVDNLSLSIGRGETVGLVGESGCGKSVTALSILRLIPKPAGKIVSGEILFNGRNLLTEPLQALRSIRGRSMSMIFQEPMTALSPLHRIGNQLCEMLLAHQKVSRRDAWKTGTEWLDKVGINDPAGQMHAYPHQLSGGMRQRVMIAMALMLDPELIIADEPTTALDVTIQAQIFDLIAQMKKKDTSLLLITHDMGVIWEMCNRVIVMYASRIAEQGPLQQIFDTPSHPYTQGLLKAIPAYAGRSGRLFTIEGQVPAPIDYPQGCHFADRCPSVFDRCRTEQPQLYPVADGHQAACFLKEAHRD
jgi:peptide/nickel transport system ATP-binding protein/oligopeptide transport system ATP-binding protein